MLRDTISLPTPLSPVIRTLASLRATRSISACSACIWGLFPINRTCCLVRECMPAPIVLTVLKSRVVASTVASLIRKSFNHALVLTAERHKRGANREPFGVARSLWLHSLDAHVRRERNPAKIESERAARGEFDGLRRFEQHAAKADV